MSEDGFIVLGVQDFDGIEYGVVSYLNDVPQWGIPISGEGLHSKGIKCQWCGSMNIDHGNCIKCGGPNICYNSLTEY